MSSVEKVEEASENLASTILDAALDLGEVRSWEKLHLYDIAETLGISLDQIRRYYAQKDDLVDAWFERADHAVLSMDVSPDFFRLREAQRLEHVLMLWFEALSPHRTLTRQMLWYKLEFGHIHLQVLGIMRISRTVQWIREVARLESINLLRILEETALTTIYLRAFFCWLYDDSRDYENTRKLLKMHLGRAERAVSLFDVIRY